MHVVAITLAATVCNVGTIACIRKCRHAVLTGTSAVIWLFGIALTILATQYLLLWADVKGVSLGLAVSIVIVSVMVTAAFLGIDAEGRFAVQPLKTMPALALAGYAFAVLGVLLVGLSQR